MDNPNFLARDAFDLLDQAEAIVNKAVTEQRALTSTESARIELLKAQAAPMLDRAAQLKRALQAGR